MIVNTIYTSRIGYKGLDKLDITVKGNDTLGKHFAPTWKMVMDLKNGIISWDNYKYQYYSILYNQFDKNPHYFKVIYSKPEITFVCYCSNPERCHRTLLAKFFSDLKLTRYKSVYKGER